MGIYLTPEFDEDRKAARISNKILCKAAGKIFEGLKGDHLGKYTYKKRLQLPGVSAADGARSIVFFNNGDHVYFFDMYLKSELSKKKGKELEDDEIDAYCNVAPGFVDMTSDKIAELIESKELIEVKCDE